MPYTTGLEKHCELRLVYVSEPVAKHFITCHCPDPVYRVVSINVISFVISYLSVRSSLEVDGVYFGSQSQRDSIHYGGEDMAEEPESLPDHIIVHIQEAETKQEMD